VIKLTKTKRKSPIRHKVKSHTRQNRPVRSYVRGSGKNPPKIQTKRRVLTSKELEKRNEEDYELFEKAMTPKDEKYRQTKLKWFQNPDYMSGGVYGGDEIDITVFRRNKDGSLDIVVGGIDYRAFTQRYSKKRLTERMKDLYDFYSDKGKKQNISVSATSRYDGSQVANLGKV
jgi:hypothetical protein